jgi:hypothetical protein
VEAEEGRKDAEPRNLSSSHVQSLWVIFSCAIVIDLNWVRACAVAFVFLNNDG